MFQLKTFSFLLLACLSTSLAIGLTGSPKLAFGQTVRFETNVGDVEIVLHPDDAPIAVANFLFYVNSPAGSNYDGTFIHRAVPGFIVQGGGFFAPVNGTVAEVPAQAPIMNEFGILTHVAPSRLQNLVATPTVRPINGFSTPPTTAQT